MHYAKLIYENICKKQGILIERIRQIMIDYVYNSEVESTTIEQFIIALKIQRVKELLIFGEDTNSRNCL